MSPEERAVYCRERNAVALDRYRKGAPFGALACFVLATLGSAGLDERAAWITRIGGVTAAVLAVVAIPLTRARWVAPRPNTLFFAASLPVAAAAGLVAAYTGGFESSAIAAVTLLWVFGSVVTPIGPVSALVDAAGQLGVATAVILVASPRCGSPVMFAAINACGVALLFAGLSLRERADRRAFLVQRSLDETNGRLANMNIELEGRVSEQVAEIRKRAADIDALNAQLQQRVIERSRELAAALSRLSRSELSGPDSESRPAPGAVLNGRIKIVRTLDAGGMGEIFEGIDTLTQSRVAVKAIHSGRSSDVATLQRFLTEARAAAAVRHDAIVRTLDVDVTPTGSLFHVMELLEGENLEDWFVRTTTRPLQAIARVGHVVADALAAVHAAGLVHRDIKPSNIMMVAQPPGAKIFDFGVAKLRDQGPEEDVLRTQGHMILGTPAYMAPEQVSDPSSVGPAADIYSLGVVLYEALSFTLPHAAASATTHFIAITTTSPTPLRQRCPALPAELAELVMRCLAREPAERPTASTVATELVQYRDSPVELGRTVSRVEAVTETMVVQR
jgi:serine/threonine-protein kinase